MKTAWRWLPAFSVRFLLFTRPPSTQSGSIASITSVDQISISGRKVPTATKLPLATRERKVTGGTLSIQAIEGLGHAVQPGQAQRVRREENIVMKVEVARGLVVHVNFERTMGYAASIHGPLILVGFGSEENVIRGANVQVLLIIGIPLVLCVNSSRRIATSSNAMFGSFLGSIDSAAIGSPRRPLAANSLSPMFSPLSSGTTDSS